MRLSVNYEIISLELILIFRMKFDVCFTEVLALVTEFIEKMILLFVEVSVYA